MILGFMKKLPWGEPTNFKEKIIKGHKAHTFRAGHRWKPGHKIHMHTGNRYKPEKFNPAVINADWWDVADEDKWKETHHHDVPGRSVAVPIVTAIQEWEIGETGGKLTLKIGGYQLSEELIDHVAERDGLTPEQFRRYFRARLEQHRKQNGGEPFTGQIIHWQRSYWFAPAEQYDPLTPKA